jgi:hypothetical protein
LFIAILGLIAVLVGFAKTFFLPVAYGEFKAPLVIHIHGGFAFAWVGLFLLQTSLIHIRKYALHKTFGWLGIAIASGVMITLVPAGMYVVKRDLCNGVGEASYSSLVGIVTSGIMFFVLVLAAMLERKDPEYHKRLMVLSLIVVLWPAWFRFRHYFPSVPRPDIWFALVLPDSLIVGAWIWDKVKNGSIHPVLKYVGIFIIVEQSFEVFMFDTPVWRSVAFWMFNLF